MTTSSSMLNEPTVSQTWESVRSGSLVLQIAVDARTTARVLELAGPQPALHENASLLVSLHSDGLEPGLVSVDAIVASRRYRVIEDLAVMVHRVVESDGMHHIEIVERGRNEAKGVAGLRVASVSVGGSISRPFVRCDLLSRLGFCGGAYDPPEVESRPVCADVHVA